MAWLARTVERLDQVSPGKLLIPNAFIALWVLLAHGGALLLVQLGYIPSADFGSRLDYAYLTIIPAAALLVLTFVAWIRPATLSWILKVQAVVFLALAVYALYYALDVVVNGVPTVNRFTWSIGAFVFLLAYPVYLARRALLPSGAIGNLGLRYAHVIAAVVAIGISLLIFWRIDGVA